MKQIRINLSEDQYEKLIAKLHGEAKIDLEEGVLSGFSITLEEAFPGVTSLIVNRNGELDLGAVSWKIH